MPDVIQDIVRDHRIVAKMFDQYHATPDDGLAQDLCTEIALHAAAEETVVYPELRRFGPGDNGTGADGVELAERAELEHADVQARIAQILASPPPDLREPMAWIESALRTHIAYEEKQILPRLRGLDREALSHAFADAKHGIRSRSGAPMY